ncbi:MAG: ribose 5-phosphate isomerase B [Clostridia bacterium]|nr:ribose 5-phosphate isomerase B [Clostridia bacterium]
MKIAIGSDHGGVELKETLKIYLTELGHTYDDCGTNSHDSVDYPDIAKEVCSKIVNKDCDFGILVCGTGIGMSIAANKIDGIRAAVCSDEFSARMTKSHNNSNVICFGQRVIGDELAKSVLTAYMEAEFMGGRHQVRVDKITSLE